MALDGAAIDECELAAFFEALDVATALVSALDGDDLLRATPCEDWNVANLVRHMTTSHRAAAVALSQGEVTAAAFPVEDRVGHPPDRWLDAVAQVRGVATIEAMDDGLVALPFGGCTRRELLRIVTFDTVVHVLDLEVALQRWVSPTALHEHALAMAPQMVPPVFRFDGGFGPEVPVAADASNALRLLAYTGRSVP